MRSDCRLPHHVREPRWPAVIATLCVGGMHAALPNDIAIGPPWLMPAIVLILLIPTVISHQRGHHDTNAFLGFVVAGTLTIYLAWSLTLLVLALPTRKESPDALLRSAVVLWVTNVLVFALWYWRLDAGGPHARDVRRHEGEEHTRGAFLFPQMTMDTPAADAWTPQFADYLFVAFNTSTALSPTDTAVLSRWAKLLMMVQSSISLSIVALLASRAVNIL